MVVATRMVYGMVLNMVITRALKTKIRCMQSSLQSWSSLSYSSVAEFAHTYSAEEINTRLQLQEIVSALCHQVEHQVDRLVDHHKDLQDALLEDLQEGR